MRKILRCVTFALLWLGLVAFACTLQVAQLWIESEPFLEVLFSDPGKLYEYLRGFMVLSFDDILAKRDGSLITERIWGITQADLQPRAHGLYRLLWLAIKVYLSIPFAITYLIKVSPFCNIICILCGIDSDSIFGIDALVFILFMLVLYVLIRLSCRCYIWLEKTATRCDAYVTHETLRVAGEVAELLLRATRSTRVWFSVHPNCAFFAEFVAIWALIWGYHAAALHLPALFSALFDTALKFAISEYEAFDYWIFWKWGSHVLLGLSTVFALFLHEILLVPLLLVSPLIALLGFLWAAYRLLKLLTVARLLAALRFTLRVAGCFFVLASAWELCDVLTPFVSQPTHDVLKVLYWPLAILGTFCCTAGPSGCWLFFRAAQLTNSAYWYVGISIPLLPSLQLMWFLLVFSSVLVVFWALHCYLTALIRRYSKG